MLQQRLTVLIVGCGNIAGGFDNGLDSTQLPCTHAGAYSHDGRFALQVCIDPDDSVRDRFMKTWNVKQGFRTLEEALSAGVSVDIISICSPTPHHKNDVIFAIKFNPKLIFCEKPVTASVSESKLLVAACDEAGILLAVNHNRRWDPKVTQLKLDLISGIYGTLRSVVGYYNKGMLNNGSHLIDLLHYLFGDLEVLAVLEGVADNSAEDLSYPSLIRTKAGVPVHLVTGHADDYSLFELQLICSNAVLTMRDGGLSWHLRKAIDSDRFKGYQVLDSGELMPGGYQYSGLSAVDNIYNALTIGEELASSGRSALNAQVVCEKISG